MSVIQIESKLRYKSASIRNVTTLYSCLMMKDYIVQEGTLISLGGPVDS